MITHSWNGTVLTITSDSGTSSADLKGEPGVRGAQGAAGIIMDTTGNVDLTPYPTIADLAAKATVSLDFSGWGAGYFTERLADGTELTHYITYDDSGKIANVAGIAVEGV